MKAALALACALALSEPVLHAGQQAGGSAPTDPPKAAAPRFLPDGRLEVTNADGSKSISPLAAPSFEPAAPPAWVKDADTNARFLSAMRGFYDYHSAGYMHRQRVFEWQLFSGQLIFVTVLLLVATGMVFAAIQFRVGLRKTATASQGEKAADPVTQIEIAATSVKVSSPVLGVIILVISLAFFYLYLVYVYPIKEIL